MAEMAQEAKKKGSRSTSVELSYISIDSSTPTSLHLVLVYLFHLRAFGSLPTDCMGPEL